MAKSLRSKTKRAFRKIKRDDPKSDYHIRDKLRLQRVTEKLKVLTPASDDEAEEGDESAVLDGETAMAEDGTTASKQAGPSTIPMVTEEPAQKISTSGRRESSNMEWRKKTGLGPKKRTSANSTTFAKPKQYKSPGRAKRARN